MSYEDADQVMADPEENIGGLENRQDEPSEVLVKVVIDEDHPFDLEGYISQYSGSWGDTYNNECIID